MFEIRIHSRGGQGGVTAARLLALAAIHDGKYATAAPFYGAERRGAPIVSFVRIDDKPIKVYSQIKKPDMVIVLDASVMQGNGRMLEAEVIVRRAPEGRHLLDKLVLLGCVAAFDSEGAKHRWPAGC